MMSAIAFILEEDVTMAWGFMETLIPVHWLFENLGTCGHQ